MEFIVFRRSLNDKDFCCKRGSVSKRREFVRNRRSHTKVTIRSVLMLLNYFNYLVVPASHSKRAGL
jgi:hypothetical protein